MRLCQAFGARIGAVRPSRDDLTSHIDVSMEVDGDEGSEEQAMKIAQTIRASMEHVVDEKLLQAGQYGGYTSSRG